MSLQFNPFTGTFDVTTKGDTGNVSAAGDGTAAAPGITFASENIGLFRPGASTLGLSTGGLERLRITSTGQLSHIGAGSSGSPAVSFSGSAPSNSLVVDSSGNVGVGGLPLGETFVVDNANATIRAKGTGAGASMRMYASSGGAAILETTTNHALLFRTNSQPRMVIDTAGLVGIGTSTPVQTLTVASNIALGGSGNNGIEFYNATPTATALRWFLANNSGASDTLQLYRYNSSGGYAGAPVCVDSSGRVGIGTASPSKRFTILQDGTDSALRIEQSGEGYNFYRNQANGFLYLEGPQQTFSGFGFRVTPTGGSTTNAVWIDNSGRVGIGTTSPSSPLHVEGNILANKASGNTGITAQSGSILCNIGSQDGVGHFVYGTGAYPLTFSTNATERARIDSSGRFLVGTASNSGGALLQVNGDRIRVATAKTPASATDTGTAGEICWDANYIYVCTATNNWKRTAIATW